MHFAGLSLFAIVLAAVVSFMFGWLWYGILFPKQWMAAAGKTEADDQHVALEWVVATAFETPAVGIDLQQSVNGLGSEPGGFRHPFGGAASRCAEQ